MKLIELFENLDEAIEKAHVPSGDIINVYRNPTPDQLLNLIERKFSGGARGITDGKTHWIWDAYEEIHYNIANALGMDYGNVLGYSIAVYRQRVRPADVNIDRKDKTYWVKIEPGDPTLREYLKKDPKFIRMLSQLEWNFRGEG